MKSRNKKYVLKNKSDAPVYRHLAKYTMIAPDDVADTSKS